MNLLYRFYYGDDDDDMYMHNTMVCVYELRCESGINVRLLMRVTSLFYCMRSIN